MIYTDGPPTIASAGTRAPAGFVPQVDAAFLVNDARIKTSIPRSSRLATAADIASNVLEDYRAAGW